MNKNMIFFTILLGLSLSIKAMEEMGNLGSAAPQYKGVHLTPQNIAKYAQMPENIAQDVNPWIDKNSCLLQQLVPTWDKIPTTMEGRLEELRAAKEVLKKNGFEVPTVEREINGTKEVLPRNTLVLNLPGNMVAQVSTSVHKRYNIESYNGKGWGAGFDPEKDKLYPTYQTVSRAFYALLGLQAKSQHEITNFYIPQSYLAQVPDRESIFNEARDENSFVVQEYMKPNLVLLKDNLQEITKLDKKTIEDTYKMIKKAFLWDIYNSCYFDGSNNTLAQYDLQQRNHHNPELAFYAYPTGKTLNAWKAEGKKSAQYLVEHDITCGVEGFAILLKDARNAGHQVDQQCAQFKALIENDPEIQQFKNMNFISQINTALKYGQN